MQHIPKPLRLLVAAYTLTSNAEPMPKGRDFDVYGTTEGRVELPVLRWVAAVWKAWHGRTQAKHWSCDESILLTDAIKSGNLRAVTWMRQYYSMCCIETAFSWDVIDSLVENGHTGMLYWCVWQATITVFHGRRDDEITVRAPNKIIIHAPNEMQGLWERVVEGMDKTSQLKPGLFHTFRRRMPEYSQPSEMLSRVFPPNKYYRDDHPHRHPVIADWVLRTIYRLMVHDATLREVLCTSACGSIASYLYWRRQSVWREKFLNRCLSYNADAVAFYWRCSALYAGDVHTAERFRRKQGEKLSARLDYCELGELVWYLCKHNMLDALRYFAAYEESIGALCSEVYANDDETIVSRTWRGNDNTRDYHLLVSARKNSQILVWAKTLLDIDSLHRLMVDICRMEYDVALHAFDAYTNDLRKKRYHFWDT